MKIIIVSLLYISLTACAGIGYISVDEEIENVQAGVSKDSILLSNDWRQDQLKGLNNDSLDRLVYESKSWCGALILIVPLMLPVCDTTDTYYFESEILVRKEIKSTSLNGLFCSVFPVCEGGGDCSLCLIE